MRYIVTAYENLHDFRYEGVHKWVALKLHR